MSLTRSQVAKAVQINVETLRYYEKRGLIKEPPRSASGYRLFPHDTIERIQFIKRAQELGFTLEEIKHMIALSEEPEKYEAVEIQNFTNEKITEIKEKIRDLMRMQVALEELAELCPGEGHPISECPIIKSLTEGNPSKK